MLFIKVKGEYLGTWMHVISLFSGEVSQRLIWIFNISCHYF